MLYEVAARNGGRRRINTFTTQGHVCFDICGCTAEVVGGGEYEDLNSQRTCLRDATIMKTKSLKFEGSAGVEDRGEDGGTLRQDLPCCVCVGG